MSLNPLVTQCSELIRGQIKRQTPLLIYRYLNSLIIDYYEISETPFHFLSTLAEIFKSILNKIHSVN